MFAGPNGQRSDPAHRLIVLYVHWLSACSCAPRRIGVDPAVRAFDPKQPQQTTDRNDSFLEENEITDQVKKAKKLVVLTGSKRNRSCQPLDSSSA
ncbi:hypothetical protein EMIT0P265_30072 [Pseudomonas zeae]